MPEQLSLFYRNEEKQTFDDICNLLGCENYQPGWPDSFGNEMRDFTNKYINKVRTLSLFSGAGGLDIGFNDIGFDIIQSVEIESKFCETLELNSGDGKRFPYSKVDCIDIREYDVDAIGEIDFIIGGPPCQTFSAAGRRAEGVSGITDARGVLFREYVRILKKLSPKGFLFENVYGIVGAQNGKAWKEICTSFEQAGYMLFFRIIDAADYGVPQFRERLIIVGLKEGEFLFPRPTHGPDSPGSSLYYCAEDAISSIQLSETEKKCGINGKYGSLLNDIPPGLNYSFYTENMGHPQPLFAWRSKFSDFLYKADPNTPVRTIKAQGGQYTGPFHWDNRPFATSELKRLQTFPDDYVISGNKQTVIQQIGNSVPPQVARIFAIAIQEQVFEAKFPFELPYLQWNEELGFRSRKRALTAEYQKKAKDAIKKLQLQQLKIPKCKKYMAILLDNFDFREINEAGIAKFSISVNWGDSLEIYINDADSSKSYEVFTLKIKSRKNDWNVGANEIIIHGLSLNKLAFTVAWKAIEKELSEMQIKADLVQLNGYYQYQPRILCQMEQNDPDYFWKILSKIVERDCIREVLSTSELASKWGIRENEVLEVAERLKELGYEVRNHSTNPQIASDNWLIPYAFPTLTPMSVQLRKSLR